MANMQEILVEKSELTNSKQRTIPNLLPVAAGEVCVEIERFSLTTNNITYAVFGEMLNYWGYFPTEKGFGVVPVWGFGEVVASRCEAIAVGERIFGFLPMSSHVTLMPDAVSDLCFSDSMPHRLDLHPWYNRYFRCDQDPVYSEATVDAQSVLWALFMTGWKLAEQLSGKSDALVVSSASSKTAIATAWAMSLFNPDASIIGITSDSNRAFVESLGIYTHVQSYDRIAFDDSFHQAAYVDVAGSAAVTSAIHVALNDRLAHSVTLGATHRAPPSSDLPMPGPVPSFFFIPTEAEADAASLGFEKAHLKFAIAWRDFALWSASWLDLEFGSGIDAIEAGYLATLKGGLSPSSAKVFSWS
ncbi:MAG: DUF2855 family protein [Pseudomonadota bacterium]